MIPSKAFSFRLFIVKLIQTCYNIYLKFSLLFKVTQHFLQLETFKGFVTTTTTIELHDSICKFDVNFIIKPTHAPKLRFIFPFPFLVLSIKKVSAT